MGLFGKKKEDKSAQGKSVQKTEQELAEKQPTEEQPAEKEPTEEQATEKHPAEKQPAEKRPAEGIHPRRRRNHRHEVHPGRHIKAEMAVPPGGRTWERLGGIRGQGQPGIRE